MQWFNALMAKLTKVFDDIRVSIFAFLATSQNKKPWKSFFFLAHCPPNYPLLLLSPDSFASLFLQSFTTWVNSLFCSKVHKICCLISTLLPLLFVKENQPICSASDHRQREYDFAQLVNVIEHLATNTYLFSNTYTQLVQRHNDTSKLSANSN